MQILKPNYNWAWGPSWRTRTAEIIVHHAAGDGSPEAIHAYHLKLGWRGIAYNFYVRKDGRVYEGREENAVGGHTGGSHNGISVGICFEGNFELEQMSNAQLQAGRELLAYLRAKYGDIPVLKHRDVDPTACPGRFFPWDELTSKEDTKMQEQIDALKKELQGLQEAVSNVDPIYQRIEDVPDWAQDAVRRRVNDGIIQGTGDGLYRLSYSLLQFIVMEDRAAGTR